MIYLLLILLSLRPFICEQTAVKDEMFFNAFLFLLIFISFFIKRKIVIKSSGGCWALIPLVTFLLGSLCFSKTYISFNEIIQVLTNVCLFVFALTLNKKELRFFISAAILVGIVISSRAIYQYVHGFAYIAEHSSIAAAGFYAQDMISQRRVVGWFSGPNILAGYILMLAAVCFAHIVEFLKEGNKRQLRAFCFAGLFLFAALLATKAVSAIFSLIAGLSVFAVIILKKNILLRKIIIGMIFFMICCSGFVFMNRINCFLNLNNSNNSLTQRVNYWTSSILMIKENPIAGVGAGNFGLVYPRFKKTSANETNYAHNLFLQLWVENGIFYLACFVLFLMCLFKHLFSEKEDCLKLGLALGCAAFLIYNMFDFSFFVSQASHLWWIFAACGLAWGKEDGRIEHGQNNEKKEIFFKFVFCGIILFLTFNFFIRYSSECELNKGIDFLKDKKYDQASLAIRKSLRVTPKNDYGHYLLAITYEKSNSGIFSDEVIEQYKKAISLNPGYAYYYYYLADYFRINKKYQEAQEFLKKALIFYPQNDKFLSEMKSLEY
ncbi:MAG: O-antigen ligase family protein [Candidatus Omnitrophota bacterium]